MRAFGRLRQFIAVIAATLMVLAASVSVALPTSAVEPGSITGTVTGAGDGLSGISVNLYSLGQYGWQYGGTVETSAQGAYEIRGLAPARYRLCFDDGPGAYLFECWNNKPSLEQAEDVAVGAGAGAVADAVLAAEGRIAGVVTDSTGTGIAGISVSVHQWSPNQSYWSGVGSAQTRSDGTYEVGNLRAGTYRVCFSDYGNTYVRECWNDKPSVEKADDIPVAEGARVADKDAVLSEEGRISGRLVDVSGAGVPNLGVAVRQKAVGSSMWDWVTSGQTDSTGHYELGGLRAGTYRVCFNGYNTDFLTECWNDKATVELAEDIVVAVGARVTGKDAVLARAGRISGTVTNSQGEGIANLYATVQQKVAGTSSWQGINSVSTNGQGIYEVGGLKAGTYRVCFQTYMTAYVSECWNNQATVDRAQDIPVAEGEVVAGTDAVLAKGSRISGTVVDSSGAPLSNVYVSASVKGSSNLADGWWASSTTGADGKYELTGLRAGTYRVCFSSTSGYQCWPNQSTSEQAGDVVVGEEVLVSGVDARISNERYTNVDAPTVSGAPQVGKPLTVSPGVWSPTGASFEYLWEVGGRTVEGVTGDTFTPRPGDAGKDLGVWVTPFGDAATGYAYYVYVGDVVGATPSPTPTPTPTPTATPTPVPTPTPMPGPDVASQLSLIAKQLTVVGKPKVGKTIKVAKIVDQLRTTVSYKFQWYAGSAKIRNATKSKLKIDKGMKGKKLRVKVTLAADGARKVATINVGKVV